MFTFLLVVHAIIAAALVAVILMQRSEGGGLGMGGSPSGLMSARGAADFLTRATTILATLFVLMCIGLATLASMRGAGVELDTSLARQPAPVQQSPLGDPAAPLGNVTADPLAAPLGAATGATTQTTPAQAPAQRTAAPVRVERAPQPASNDPVAATTPAPVRVVPPPVTRTTPAAPGNTTLPGVIRSPGIPAGNATQPPANNSATPNQ